MQPVLAHPADAERGTTRFVAALRPLFLAAAELGVDVDAACPSDPRAYEDYFKSPVRFGAERSEMVFPRAFLEAHVRNGDPTARDALTQRATELIARRPAEGPAPGFVERARSSAAVAVADGEWRDVRRVDRGAPRLRRPEHVCARVPEVDGDVPDRLPRSTRLTPRVSSRETDVRSPRSRRRARPPRRAAPRRPRPARTRDRP